MAKPRDAGRARPRQSGVMQPQGPPPVGRTHLQMEGGDGQDREAALHIAIKVAMHNKLLTRTFEGRMHTQVALTYPVSHDPCSNRKACACSHTLACAHAWHVAVTMCAHPGESARRRAGVGAMVCVPPGEMPGAPPIVCVRPGESARSGAGACAPMRHTPRLVWTSMRTPTLVRSRRSPLPPTTPRSQVSNDAHGTVATCGREGGGTAEGRSGVRWRWSANTRLSIPSSA